MIDGPHPVATQKHRGASSLMQRKNSAVVMNMDDMKANHPYETLKSLADRGKLQCARHLAEMTADKHHLRVDDACWLNGEGDYELEVKMDETKVTITGPSPNAVEGTLSALLQIFLGNTIKHMIIKAFATQPRQLLPVLSPSFVFSKENSDDSKSLVIHFCAVPSCKTWKHISSQVGILELRQCQVHDWKSIGSPTNLVLSLAMPDFVSFGKSDMIKTHVEKLSLVLHFWLQGDPWDTFCRVLSDSGSIKALVIEYLELGDEGWELLWKHLPPSIESVSLSFTDNFVDEHRRITPERRFVRSNDVLGAVSLYESLRSVSFPACQQDERTMAKMTEILESRGP